MARAWQHPFLNVFRYFRVDEWKRSAKEGDVAVVTVGGGAPGGARLPVLSVTPGPSPGPRVSGVLSVTPGPLVGAARLPGAVGDPRALAGAARLRGAVRDPRAPRRGRASPGAVGDPRALARAARLRDKTLKGNVYRIRGSVSAANYIQLPKTSTQSLGLTGRYLYVLFRPLPSKHFIIHLDVSTEDGQVIRVSFSNLFKEFKSTATWLQFPFILEAGTLQRGDNEMGHGWCRRPPLWPGGQPGVAQAHGSGSWRLSGGWVLTLSAHPAGLVGLAAAGPRWTCLQLDLQDILLVYLNRRYHHLKGIRLCASLLVRNLYTSDLCFQPGERHTCAPYAVSSRFSALEGPE
ncbi:hypothetical protein P7K49_022637 [Saguinus oedipus]|uniref:CFA20 domain-containing protein n=1 Tax=Saguinus oedipus TaxID=9490 RepID=A0ABQ9UJF1_SAGOE|nr:hypothetical protein P7K49_022637 [Saguinus oedipus]